MGTPYNLPVASLKDNPESLINFAISAFLLVLTDANKNVRIS